MTVVVGFNAGSCALFGLAACNGSVRCIFCNFAARIPVTSLGSSGRELNYTARDPAETPFRLFFQLDDLMNVGKMVSYFFDALDRGESD